MATGAASGPTAAGSTLSGAYLRAQRSGGAVRCERGPVRAVGDERGVDIGGGQNAAGQSAALFPDRGGDGDPPEFVDPPGPPHRRDVGPGQPALPCSRGREPGHRTLVSGGPRGLEIGEVGQGAQPFVQTLVVQCDRPARFQAERSRG